MFEAYRKCKTEQEILAAADEYINEEDEEQKRKRQIIDDFFNQKAESSCSDDEEAKQEDPEFGCPGKHELTQFITEDDKYFCDVCSEGQVEGATMFGCRICEYDAC